MGFSPTGDRREEAPEREGSSHGVRRFEPGHALAHRMICARLWET
jgi:hypothetical protein